jgi:hypothetical protein
MAARERGDEFGFGVFIPVPLQRQGRELESRRPSFRARFQRGDVGFRKVYLHYAAEKVIDLGI